jgi:hypothetical protein
VEVFTAAETPELADDSDVGLESLARLVSVILPFRSGFTGEKHPQEE